MPLIPTLAFLTLQLGLWMICRIYAARSTFSSLGLLVFYTFGCVGSTMLALYLQAVPVPFPMGEGVYGAPVAPETWLTGPSIEEFAKAVPLLVLVAFAPAARRMAIADFALIGFTTALGFAFVEGNFGRVLSADVGGWGRLLALDYDTGQRGDYHIYDAQHWVHTALIGLGLGVGVRLWPDNWKKWLPGAVMFAIVAFDHSMWNFKAQHEWPNSMDPAAKPWEWLYVLTMHGALEIFALPVLLVAVSWWESRRIGRGVPNARALQLPGERPGLRGEVSLLIRRHDLGIGSFRRTLAYFRHRRAYALALADPTGGGYPQIARRRLEAELAQVTDPAPAPWPPTAAQTVAWAKSFGRQFRIPLIISGLSLLVFGIAPHYLPWLHQSNMAWLATLMAVGFLAWRIVLYRRAPAPTPGEAGGEQLAQRRTRALLLCSSVAATGIPIVSLLLHRQALAPAVHIAFISAYLGSWIEAGGSPVMLAALGGAAAAATIAPEPAPACGDLRREVLAGADSVAVLWSAIQRLTDGDAERFNTLVNEVRPGIDLPGHPEGWICALPPPVGSRDPGFRLPWEQNALDTLTGLKAVRATPGVGAAPVSVDTSVFHQLWTKYAAERTAQAARQGALDICMGQEPPVEGPLGLPLPSHTTPESGLDDGRPPKPLDSGDKHNRGDHIRNRPLGEPDPSGGDLHTREKPGTGAPDAQAGRDAANKPPIPVTQERDGTGSPEAQAGRDAANAAPTPTTQERDGTGAPDAQAGRDAANAPPPDLSPEAAAATDALRPVDIPPSDPTPRTQEKAGAPDAEGGRDAANVPPAPAKAAAQLEEEAYIKAEADAAAARGPADPNSPAEVLKRAKAGDAEAQKQWDAMKTQGQPSIMEGALQKALDQASPTAGAILRGIGGTETLNELGKTDWGTELDKSVGALKDAIGKKAEESVDYIKKTASDGVSLLNMDDEELASTWNQAAKEVKDSRVGELVKQAGSLTDMSLDEVVGTAKQTVSDAAGTVQKLYQGMTAEEFQAHLNDADRAIFVEKQKLWQTDPEAARKFFANFSAEALKQVVLTATGEKVVAAVGEIPSLLTGGVKAADALVEANAAHTAASELAAAQRAASELGGAGRAVEEVGAASNAATGADAAHEAGVAADTVKEVKAASGAAGDATALEQPHAAPAEAPAEGPVGRHDGETQVNKAAEDPARVERASSDTVRGQAQKPATMNDRDLGDAPISAKEQPGTRLPPDHDPIAVDKTDPPIDPRTGKAFPEGGNPPSDIGESAGKGPHGEAGPRDPNATTKIEGQDGNAASTPRPENYQGHDMDWRAAPKSDTEAWGTRKAYDPYKVDPHDPPINPATDKQFGDQPGHSLPGNEMPKPAEPKMGTSGGETADIKPQGPQLPKGAEPVETPASKGEPEPQPGKPGTETADLKPQELSPPPKGGAGPTAGTTAKLDPAEMPGDAATGPKGTQVLEPHALPDGGKTPGPGVERGLDGRSPIRMTREEARARLGEDIGPASSPRAGVEPPAPPPPRDLPQPKLPETTVRPRVDLPETAVRPSPAAAEGPTTTRLPDPELPRAELPETVRRPSAEPSPAETAAVAPQEHSPAAAETKPEPAPLSKGRAAFKAAQDDAAGVLRDAHYEPYADGIKELRAMPGRDGLPLGSSGPCEATQSLLSRPEYAGARSASVKIGELNHEVIINAQGNVVDPFAQQAVRDGFVSAEHVAANNLGGAIEKGVFTPKQWAVFSGAPPPSRFTAR